jgi:hypothetical protein
MELLSTYLVSLSEKLLSLTSRKEATSISRDMKKAAKVNCLLSSTIKANAQKCAPVGNLLYVHNRKAVAKKQQQGATLWTKEEDSQRMVEDLLIEEQQNLGKPTVSPTPCKKK